MTLKKNVSGQFLYLALIKASDGSALTGASITGYRSIDGGSQNTITGTITELANGQYKVALSQADTNGNNIGFLFTASLAVPIGYSVFTTAADPTDGVRLGLTALPNAAAAANGGLPTVNASNQVAVAAGLHKNTAFSNFLFFMTDAATHLPKTGLVNGDFTIKTVSLDGAASTTIAGTITEVDSGFYKVNLLAGETNGNNLAFEFKATGSDPTVITVVTGT